MSMRYIIRRTAPENLEEVRRYVGNLDERLGTAEAGRLFTEVEHVFSPARRVVFGCSVRKEGDSYRWVCPSVELVAETEADFRGLAQEFGVEDLSHLESEPV